MFGKHCWHIYLMHMLYSGMFAYATLCTHTFSAIKRCFALH